MGLPTAYQALTQAFALQYQALEMHGEASVKHVPVDLQLIGTCLTGDWYLLDS